MALWQIQEDRNVNTYEIKVVVSTDRMPIFPFPLRCCDCVTLYSSFKVLERDTALQATSVGKLVERIETGCWQSVDGPVDTIAMKTTLKMTRVCQLRPSAPC